MSMSDPKSKSDLEKLAKREKEGGYLNRNDRWELDRARRSGTKDTKGQKL